MVKKPSGSRKSGKKKKSAAHEALCVMGMHGSGTSLITNMLRIGGMYLGPPEDIMAPNDDYPLGSWENSRLREINDTILGHFGGSWDCPPSLQNRWQFDQALEQTYQKARDYLKVFSDSSSWGWKDPRNSILSPFWKLLIPKIRFVICIRNPLEVAQSLARRNRIPVEQSLSLWYLYLDKAISETEGFPRIFISYEDFFTDNAPREIKRLLQFCGLKPPGKMSPLLDIIVPEMQSQICKTATLLSHDQILTEHKMTFILLRSLTTIGFFKVFPDQSVETIISENVAQFWTLMRQYHEKNQIMQLQANVREKENQVYLAEKTIKMLRQTTHSHEQYISKIDSANNKLENEVTLLRQNLQSQFDLIKSKDEQIREFPRQLENIIRGYETLQSTFNDKLDQCTLLQADLKIDREKLFQKDQQIATLQEEQDTLKQQQMFLQDDLDNQTERLKSTEELVQLYQMNMKQRELSIKHLKAENFSLQKKIVAINKKLGELCKHIENLLNSKSWTLTSPLRKTVAFFRSFEKFQTPGKKTKE
ncbi:sulfotransferase [candidate division CSSED10-310 bacterium]|uniref:Sulfotransferase n=1 Tax=candidate division CSSED10-310 bacterium TaxID=2855610 RepID=A0ABV6YVY1_UNCC1